MDRATRSLLVLMFFDLTGAGAILFHFGFTIYSLIGCIVVILLCTLAGEYLKAKGIL